jgi:hypothetical protein
MKMPSKDTLSDGELIILTSGILAVVWFALA